MWCVENTLVMDVVAGGAEGVDWTLAVAGASLIALPLPLKVNIHVATPMNKPLPTIVLLSLMDVGRSSVQLDPAGNWVSRSVPT